MLRCQTESLLLELAKGRFSAFVHPVKDGASGEGMN